MGGQHPCAVLPRRIMAHMLIVSARKPCHPFGTGIAPETDHWMFHDLAPLAGKVLFLLAAEAVKFARLAAEDDE